ncbi:MAG: hypothetical protein GY737_29500 [Desulfobacteraceae bacterium]|nr:hypothetical protein [Desulfobacteraceae bacterium]
MDQEQIQLLKRSRSFHDFLTQLMVVLGEPNNEDFQRVMSRLTTIIGRRVMVEWVEGVAALEHQLGSRTPGGAIARLAQQHLTRNERERVFYQSPTSKRASKVRNRHY